MTTILLLTSLFLAQAAVPVLVPPDAPPADTVTTPGVTGVVIYYRDGRGLIGIPGGGCARVSAEEIKADPSKIVEGAKVVFDLGQDGTRKIARNVRLAD
jgi:hypothetical protein